MSCACQMICCRSWRRCIMLWPTVRHATATMASRLGLHSTGDAGAWTEARTAAARVPRGGRGHHQGKPKHSLDPQRWIILRVSLGAQMQIVLQSSPILFAEPVRTYSTLLHTLLVDPQACIRHNPEQRPLASEVYDMLAAAPSEQIGGEDKPYVRA